MKKQEPTPVTDPHVGEFLKSFMVKHRLSIAALARRLEVDDTQVNRYFKNKAVKSSVLFDICHAYQHNFFADLATTLPPHYIHAHPDTTQQERIANLEEQLKLVTAERDVLKSLFTK